MKKGLLFLLCTAMIMIFWLVADGGDSQRVEYTFTELHGIRAVAINDRGEVILQIQREASVWIPDKPNGTTGKYVDLGHIDPVRYDPEFGFVTNVNDINNKSVIVGISGAGSHYKGAHDALPFKIKAGGTLSRKNRMGSESAPTPYSINNKGEIVGELQATSTSHAIKWKQTGGYVSLGKLKPTDRLCRARDINDKGVIVGTSDEHAWIKTGANKTDLGKGEALAVNNQNVVVGASGRRACKWIGTKLSFLDGERLVTTIKILGLFGSTATSINDKAVAVGSAQVYGHKSIDKNLYAYEHAVIWKNGKRVNLDKLVKIPKAWSRLVVAQGINNKGQIIGYGIRHKRETGGVPSHEQAFLLTPVRKK